MNNFFDSWVQLDSAPKKIKFFYSLKILYFLIYYQKINYLLKNNKYMLNLNSSSSLFVFFKNKL